MGGGSLELVKQTIGEMVGQLDTSDYLAIVSFDTDVETHLQLQQVGELDAQQLRRDLASLEPRGGTNIELGYRHGLAEAAKAPSGIETKLVLLSDGHANNGIKDPVQLGQLAAFATEHLVTTSTIGIGTGFDETILASIAGSGQGNHFAAVKVEEAVAGLQDEIDGLLERSVRNLTCKITLVSANQLKAITSVGYVRSKKPLTDGIEVKLGELVSQEERGYAFLLELKAFDRNFEGLVEIEVELFGENALTGEEIGQRQTLVFEVASPVDFITPELNENVVAEIAVFRMANVKEQAARAAREGSYDEARAMIQQAQGDTQLLMEQLDEMSPRVRMRVLAENEELADLMGFTDIELSKRSTESSFRSSRAKSDPRKKSN
jgi:Ca-activated chloride channel family protein